MRFCSSILTDAFTVYSGKRFPGMSSALPLFALPRLGSDHIASAESTELSKSFAQQGIKLRVRRPGSKWVHLSHVLRRVPT